MKKKVIVLESCKQCPSRIDASWQIQSWRNIYCEATESRTITPSDDKIKFPKWCPLEDYK